MQHIDLIGKYNIFTNELEHCMMNFKCLLTLCVLVVDLLTTLLIVSKEPLCQCEAK